MTRPEEDKDLYDRLVAAFLDLACQLQGIDRIEGYRRYQTNLQFRTAVDTLTGTAWAVFKGVEPDEEVEQIDGDLFHEGKRRGPIKDMDMLRRAFDEGALGSFSSVLGDPEPPMDDGKHQPWNGRFDSPPHWDAGL